MKIFGKNYKISRPTSQLQIGLLAGVYCDCDGSVSYADRRIRIYRFLDKPNTLDTYFHELTHIIAETSGLPRDARSEKSIRKIAGGLTSWALENGIEVPIK